MKVAHEIVAKQHIRTVVADVLVARTNPMDFVVESLELKKGDRLYPIQYGSKLYDDIEFYLYDDVEFYEKVLSIKLTRDVEESRARAYQRDIWEEV